MNIKQSTLAKLRTDSPAIRAFKKAMPAGPRITTFPAFVFPIVRDDLALRMLRLPTLGWADVIDIETMPEFVRWAGDPRTGEVNIVITT